MIPRNIYTYYSLCVVCFLLGLLLGFLFLHYKVIEFENKVNYADIINALITLLVAIVIGVILTKYLSDQRIEKDTLIQLIQNTLSITQILEETIEQRNFVIAPRPSQEYIELMRSLGKIGNSLKDFEKLAEYCKIHCATHDDPNHFKGVMDRFTKARAIITNNVATKLGPNEIGELKENFRILRFGLMRTIYIINRQ